MRTNPAEAASVYVVETFVSLQGEGVWAGCPCFFVRLSGCNLRCVYCDTAYAYEGGRKRSVSSVVDQWRQGRVKLAQVTGGEPLLQKGAVALMQALVDAGASVLLETNGSLSLRDVPRSVMKVVDRKTPASGMSEFWLEENTLWLNEKDQIKFVISSREDYEWARKESARLSACVNAPIIFSPAWGDLPPAELADWIVKDRLAVRFQIQLHKLLWGDRRGV